MHAPLAPMSASDFARLANLTGLHIGEDDLVQLDRRQLLRPFGPQGVYTSAHLFVLALYFEAIRVVRHPWATRTPDRKLEDVKIRGQWLEGLLKAIDAGKIDAVGAEQGSYLLVELERYLAGIDPFGPLSRLFNIMHPEVFDGLRGDGRLFVELRAAASALSKAIDSAMNNAPDEADDDLRSTVAMDSSASFTRDNSPLSPRTSTFDRLTVERELSAEDIAAVKAEQNTQEIDEDLDDDMPATAALSEVDAAEETKAAEEAEDAKAIEQRRAAEAAEEAKAAADEANAAEEARAAEEAKAAEQAKAAEEARAAEEAAVDAAEKSEAAELNQAEPSIIVADDFDEEEHVSNPTQILPTINENARTPVLSEKKGFERDHTQRTQNLMERLEGLRSPKPLAPTKPEELEGQIEELNRLREQYLSEQNWNGLAGLYEAKIHLFEEPAEQQQIRLALATIYEAKLAEARRAFESYVFAYEIQGPSREKALDGVRRTGRSEEVQNSYQAWLEDRLTLDISADERRELQGDLALLLHKRGDSQRAFLMFASFLAEDPDRHITIESIEQLEELAESNGDEEIDGFFGDILESAPGARVTELVALRAGLAQLSRNASLHAIPMFRKVLEVAPNNEVAFTNLSRLYEGEQNWTELAGLLRKRLNRASPDARVKIEAAIERAYEQEMRTDFEAVEKWQQLLEATPDDEQALKRVMFGFQAHSKHSEAYAFLTNLLPLTSADTQKAAVLLYLADIAINHLTVIEEGQRHLEHALEVAGPTVDVLGGFVDMHMANHDFMQAVSAVESLLAVGADGMTKESKLEWLHVGIDAAERAHRGEEREKFASEVRTLESTHQG